MITLQDLQDYIRSEYAEGYIQRDEENIYFLNFEIKILDENFGFINICDKKLRVKLPDFELQSLDESDLDLSEEIDFELYYKLTKENADHYKKHLISLIDAHDKEIRDKDLGLDEQVAYYDSYGAELDRYNTLSRYSCKIDYDGGFVLYHRHKQSGLIIKMTGWWDSYNGCEMDDGLEIGCMVEKTVVVKEFKAC